MKESYRVSDLLIGELVTTTNGWQSLFYTVAEGPYIFYKKENGLYSEVFTEMEYDQYETEQSFNKPSSSITGREYKLSKNSEENKFGKTYLHQTNDSIKNYLTEEELEQNDENYSISKERVLKIYSVMLKQKALKDATNQKSEEEAKKAYQKSKNR